jgi:hypothetical protein
MNNVNTNTTPVLKIGIVGEKYIQAMNSGFRYLFSTGG